jgi:hypothetical protein
VLMSGCDGARVGPFDAEIHSVQPRPFAIAVEE